MKRSVQSLVYCAVMAMASSASVGCGGAVRASGAGHGQSTIGVEAAALPVRVLRARGGTEVASEAFHGELTKAAAVCIGESHRNPHHHWAQLQVLDYLSKTQSTRGVVVGLGMEMFQRPYQGVLDDFIAGRIDEKAMLSRTGWSDRWGYDFALYAPMVRMARARGVPIIALNTARELLKKVSRKGLDSLTPAERKRLPELVLDDKDHRAWFDALMNDMGGAHGHSKRAPHGKKKAPPDDATAEPSASPDSVEPPKHDANNPPPIRDPEAKPPKHDANNPPPTPEHGAKHHTPAPSGHEHGKAQGHGHGGKPAKSSMAERIYTAQVLWDETMADTAARWLAKGPNRQIIVLAGNGHCHDSAIVRRIVRRGPKNVVSIQPIIDDGEGNVAKELATPSNDYLFVMSRE